MLSLQGFCLLEWSDYRWYTQSMTLGEVIKGTGVERRNGLRPGLCQHSWAGVGDSDRD